MCRSCLVAVLLSLAGAAAAWAQEEPPLPLPPGPAPSAGAETARPQRVEFGWRFNLSQPSHVDRQNVSDLSIGAMDALHLGMGDSGADVAPLRVLKWGVSIWYAAAVSFMAHEYGHVSVMSKTGHRDPVYGTSETPREEWRSLSAAELFVKGLEPKKDSSVSIRQSEWEEVVAEFGGDPDALLRLNTMLEAGGFNQEQAIVTRYGVRTRDGALSFLDTTGYLWSAAGTIRYPASVDESDLGDYSELLEGRGYHASPARIKALSALRLVGGSGLASVVGLFQGFFGGQGGGVAPFFVEPSPGWRVYWPELESYLTQAGPTVRLTVPLRIDLVEILPSLERSFAGGDAVAEAALRIRAPLFAFLRLEGVVHASDAGGTWHALALEILPVPWIALSLGVEGGRGYTFQRDVYGSGNEFLEDSEHAAFVGIRIGATF